MRARCIASSFKVEWSIICRTSKYAVHNRVEARTLQTRLMEDRIFPSPAARRSLDVDARSNQPHRVDRSGEADDSSFNTGTNSNCSSNLTSVLPLELTGKGRDLWSSESYGRDNTEQMIFWKPFLVNKTADDQIQIDSPPVSDGPKLRQMMQKLNQQLTVESGPAFPYFGDN
jgi:hypothetical protein